MGLSEEQAEDRRVYRLSTSWRKDGAMANGQDRERVEPMGDERVYIRTGATVACYPRGHETNGDALFMVTLRNDAQALMLMHDLYYGEYTGG